MKKIVLAGAVTAALSLGAVMPFESSGLVNPNKVEASVLATPLPVDLPLEYITGKDEYGLDKSQYKIDLGNRTGTLVLKMYMTDKYHKNAADTLYEDTKRERTGGFGLLSAPTAFGNENYKGLVMFDRYAKVYDGMPNYQFKYTTGFADTGVNKKGERFITLGVYLDKVVNNGIYFLDTPSMSTGWWNVKAYFYEDVNVEKRVYNELGRYFPLLDKVRWGVAELKQNQIGRLTMIKDTPLLKENNGEFSRARTLKKGEHYRIYGYKEIKGKGYYAVGAGHFVEMNPTFAKYETPAKNKLHLVKTLYEE